MTRQRWNVFLLVAALAMISVPYLHSLYLDSRDGSPAVTSTSQELIQALSRAPTGQGAFTR